MAGETHDPRAIAARQWRDYRAGTPGTCFEDPSLMLGLDGAYAVQDEVTHLRVAAGDRVVGYKVGCTGPGTTAQFGMAGPIRGTLFASEIRRCGETLSTRAFANPAIEVEMAVVIGKDGAARAAFPVIELHNFVFRRPRKSLEELIANNGLNAGIVLPPEPWLSGTGSLVGHGSLCVSLDGRLLGSGGLWPMPGGAEASVTWLRHHLAAHARELAAGDIVLTGTALDLYPVDRGGHVVGGIDGVAVVECRFA
jgi:2-keto-4-pentenoate hydratase